MHISLDSWCPHQYPEECKQGPYGLDGDMLDDHFKGEAEEALGWINGIYRKGDSSEKGEHMTVGATERWLYGLQVLKKLTRDKDPLLQPVFPTQIALDWYGMRDTSRGGGWKCTVHSQGERL